MLQSYLCNKTMQHQLWSCNMVTSSSRGGRGEEVEEGRYHQMEFDISNGFWLTTDRELSYVHA